MKKIRDMFKVWAQGIGGNVGTMMAFMSVPLILAIGAAVDYSKVTSDVNRAQAAADAAALAGAKQYYENFKRREVRSAGNNFGDINFDNKFGIGDYDVKTVLRRLDDGNLEVRATIAGETENSFMGLIGKPVSPWTVKASSRIEAPPGLEVILVLDISYSMRGAKIKNMKSAVEQFINKIEPYKQGQSHLTVSIIPYGGSVNLGIAAEGWLSSVDGLAHSRRFYGCFRNKNIDRKKAGQLQAYQQGRGGRSKVILCPSEKSRALLFSRDKAQLINHVRGLDLSWGTDSPQGLSWASRFLDNEWREDARDFAENRPIFINSNTEKIVVLLTDGQVAIVDPDQDGRESRRANKSLGEFNAICREMQRQQNLSLYTIGFNVPRGGFTKALRNCVAGKGQYYQAGLNDLGGVFNDIGATLDPIRITN